jgi:hypothetical protein
MQGMITTIGSLALVFGAVVLLMLVQPPFFREALAAGLRMVPSPLAIVGVSMVLTLAFAGGISVVVKQMDETIPFARLCAQAAKIGESPDLAPLPDSFEMAQIRGECRAPHPPVAEALGYPLALALGVTFLMPFACLLVSGFAGQFRAIWCIPALLISAVLSGFFTGAVLTSKEGLGALDFACENVAAIAKSPSLASVQGRREMVDMRRACGLGQT